MKVLLDNNLPNALRKLLHCEQAFTARELLWEQLKNGDLIRSAEDNAFTILLTADQGIFYQQNNHLRQIALVVLSTNDWSVLREYVSTINQALDRCNSGSYELLILPPDDSTETTE